MTHVATIGTGKSNTAVSSLAVTLTAGAAAGHTVVGAVAWESSAGTIPTIASITDTRGNTWVVDVLAGGAGNVTDAVMVFHGRVATALQTGDTITVAISGGTRSRWAMQVDDFDDVTVSPIDKTAHNDNPGASTALSSGVTAATSQPYELLYAAFAFPSARSPSVSSPWSGGPDVETTAGSADRALQTIWRYSSTTGTKEGTLTLGSNGTYCGAIATYKATNLSPPVARVSQVKLSVPQPGAAKVARVSQVKLSLPQAPTGVARVSQVKVTVPAAAGQLPYSGLKAITSSGTFVDGGLAIVQDGA